MKKAVTITLIVIFALGLILIGTGLIVSKGNLSNVFAKDVRTESRIDETETVTSLTLSVSADDIELYPSEDDKLHIKYWDSEKRPYVYSINGGTAELKQQNSIHSWLDFSRHISKTVKVFAPESIIGTLSIQLASGSVQSKGYIANVESLKLNISSGSASIGQSIVTNANINMASGSITLASITATNLYVNIASGNFTLTNSHIDGKLDIHMSSGDAEINNCEISTLKSEISSGTLSSDTLSVAAVNCQASSGNIILRLSGAAADYTIDIDLSSGHALLDIAGQTIRTNDDLEWGSGAKSVYCKSSSGDVKIYFAS